MKPITRREVIKIMGLTAGGLAAGDATWALAQAAPGTVAPHQGLPSPALRFVHMTDMHVSLLRRGDLGFAAALAAVAALDPAPSFIITGGDHIFDGFASSHSNAMAEWKLFHNALAKGPALDIYPVIGNHDIFGWGVPTLVPPTTKGYGKAMALEQLNLKSGYYSFDSGGWHFIVLDSIAYRAPAGFFAALDVAQVKWLIADIAAVPSGTPVCVISHVPFLAGCVFLHSNTLTATSWTVPDDMLHRDAVELTGFFRRHNVKLAISGHIHLLDHLVYDDVSYICDGAVSGDWWKGTYHKTPAGFGVFDLNLDGTFQHQYVDYGWKAMK